MQENKNNTKNYSDTIKNYLKEHENKEMLRFITCGSVDDGKSTLIGRLLYDSKVVFEDQLKLAKKETKKYGSVDGDIDFALLVDGLQSEKLQGITIDVAYRFFSTPKRKFIIADTPGHEQYTRNTVTGASTAELAVILIDARKGVLTQTKRHSFIVSLMGIRNIVVAVNKMDLVGYSREVFDAIKEDYKKMYQKMKISLPYKNFFQQIDFIPISALKGDNIVNISENMKWYEGKPLLRYLEDVKILENEFKAFRMPVQYIIKERDYRGYAGNIISGTISTDETIIVYPSKIKTTVDKIILPINPENNSDPQITMATKGMPISIITKDEIDISRGDLIVKDKEMAPVVGDSFEAMIVWMDDSPLKDMEYILKIYTKETKAKISKILFKKDVNSWEKIEVERLFLNDIARVKIDLAEEIAFDMYEENKSTGAFILIDPITNNTVAGGMIVSKATKTKKQRLYTQAEIALNQYIRKYYPEWGCKDISQEDV